MVQAKLLEVITKGRTRYFKLKEIGVGTEGTYTEAEVYKALLTKRIQVDNLSIGAQYNKVLVSPSFLAMQIHKGHIDNKPEVELVKHQVKKKKAKKPKAMVSKETDPRLIEIDNQIFAIDKKINSKNISLGLREGQILKCDRPEDVAALEELASSIRKDLKSLWAKKAELQELKQSEKEKIQQEKKDKQKEASKQTRLIKAYENVISKSPYTVEEYSKLIGDLQADIEQHKSKLSSFRFKYEEDNELKTIKRLTKQLKHYENSRKMLKDAITGLLSYGIEGKDNG